MLTGRHGPKRDQEEPLDLVQSHNRTWWEATPMTYDWRRPSGSAFDSAAWFDEQDQRFLANAAFYATDVHPFDRFLPYAALRGKDVLEIGVGSGLHAELLARAEARVTGVDLTSMAISRTRRRFRAQESAGTVFPVGRRETAARIRAGVRLRLELGSHSPLLPIGTDRAQRAQLAPNGGSLRGHGLPS